MAFRKRKRDESRPSLDSILDAYHATSTPTGASHSAVATVRCWNCKKPNMYDARRSPPRRCVWCRSVI